MSRHKAEGTRQMTGIVVSMEMVQAAEREYWNADAKRGVRDMRSALEAALALVPHPPEGGKEAGEPVAWRWKWKTTGSPLEQRFADPDLYMWSYREDKPTGEAAAKMIIEPLYASSIPARDTGGAEGVALIERLNTAYDKVKEWPENRMRKDAVLELGEGFTDLLALRNLIPEIIAALTAPVRAAEVKVKPLEWKFSVDDSDRHCAETVVGFYWISQKDPDEFDLERNLTAIDGRCRTLNEAKAAAQADYEAKAAAQADYEARILSALSLSPGTGEKDERIAEQAVEQLITKLDGLVEKNERAYKAAVDDFRAEYIARHHRGQVMTDLVDALMSGVPCREERWAGNDGYDRVYDMYGATVTMREAAAEIVLLRRKLEEARDKAMEEAAALVDDMPGGPQYAIYDNIAASIRALKQTGDEKERGNESS